MTTSSPIASYGTWKSPITSDLIVAGTVGLGEISIDGTDIYWLERRPSEGGRSVVVRYASDGQHNTLTPLGFNVRSTVHEYGGGAYLVVDGTIFFSNFQDQRLYRQEPGATPVAITPADARRYADFVLDRAHNRLIAICEDHTTSDLQPTNTLVAIPLDSMGEPVTLVAGNDFYATPRISPDGKTLAWLTWNLPHMPWDGTELWTASFHDDGTVSEHHLIAGSTTESIFQPEWSPDGTLYFVSDRDEWWNLYRAQADGVARVYQMDADFGQPQWVFRMTTYAFVTADRIFCTYTQNGDWHLAFIDPHQGKRTPIPTPYTSTQSLCATPSHGFFIGGSPTAVRAVVQLDFANGTTRVLQRSSNLALEDDYLALPEAITFPTTGGLSAHAFYYPPRNRDYSAPPDEKPPLLVMSHGGPTSATSSALSLETQYWTSRGIAVLDVNYGGSSGFGRSYRRRLEGQWGIVDVDDCINGARYLVDRGLVDGDRLMITGGSAGGYTTLCALTFHEVFKAGASHFGISDLVALLASHKFESQDLFKFIGPYPEREDLYIARSPIHFADQLSCPVIFFQGLEDRVVPPEQSEKMVNVLRAKGLPVAYVAFEGEQHGFRQAEHIKRALDGEFAFYARVFGYTPSDIIEPIPIENLA